PHRADGAGHGHAQARVEPGDRSTARQVIGGAGMDRQPVPGPAEMRLPCAHAGPPLVAACLPVIAPAPVTPAAVVPHGGVSGPAVLGEVSGDLAGPAGHLCRFASTSVTTVATAASAPMMAITFAVGDHRD